MTLCLGAQCSHTLWRRPRRAWTLHARFSHATLSARSGVLSCHPCLPCTWSLGLQSMHGQTGVSLAPDTCWVFCHAQLFFLGFLIRQGSMPAYWGWWAPYIDFMRYAFFALMANEFEGRPDVLLDGVPVLEFYDITDSKWAYLGYEALFFAAFFCLAFLVSAFITRPLCCAPGPALTGACLASALAKGGKYDVRG